MPWRSQLSLDAIFSNISYYSRKKMATKKVLRLILFLNLLTVSLCGPWRDPHQQGGKKIIKKFEKIFIQKILFNVIQDSISSM